MMPVACDRLNGKTAVLLHSESDVGRVVERWLSEAGARVARLDRGESGEIAPTTSPILPTDPLHPESVRAALAEADGRFGPLHLLVTLARRTFQGAGTGVGFADLADTTGLNVRARIEAMRAAIPILRANGGGTILHVGSGFKQQIDRRSRIHWDVDHRAGESPCAVANDLLCIVSRIARKEVAKDGIRIKLIHGGLFGRVPLADGDRHRPDRIEEADPWDALTECLHGVLVDEGRAGGRDEYGLAFPGDWCELAGTAFYDLIERIDDRDLQWLLRKTTGARAWAAALTGARADIVEKIARNLPRSKRSCLLNDIARFDWNAHRRDCLVRESRASLGRLILKFHREGKVFLTP